MSRSPWTVVSLALVLVGVAFHLAVGLLYGSWTDVGVYSVTVTFVGFGLGGLLTTGGGATSS